MSWFMKKFYELQNVFAPQKTAATVEEEVSASLETLKVTELKALAKERGLKGYTSLRKAQLIEMLQQN